MRRYLRATVRDILIPAAEFTKNPGYTAPIPPPFCQELPMAISMYRASVPVFLQILPAMSGCLDKAGAYASAKKFDPAVLLQARLFADMFPLVRQVQLVSDFAKSTVARLAGVDPPKYDDTETTIDQLK